MQADVLQPPYVIASENIPKWMNPRDPSQLVITGFVLFVHFVFILWAALNFETTMPKPQRAERFIVQTIKLQEGRKGAVTSKPVEVPLPVPVQEVKEEAAVAKIEEKKEQEKIKEKKVEEVVNRDIPKEVEIALEPIPQLDPVIEKPKVEEKPIPKPDPLVKKSVPVKPVPKAPVKKPAPAKPAQKVKTTKPTVKKTTTKAKPQPPAQKKASEETKKVETKKEVVAKPDPRIAEAKAKQKKLLAEAQENLSKVDRSSPKGNGGKLSALNLPKVPGVIGGLEIDALPTTGQITLNAHEISYRDELAQRLKLLLKLPEYGKVKLKLTLMRSGKVSKVEILSAESQANKKYIEKTVPSLSFPQFGNNFEGSDQYSFVIALSNE
jgi:colicin import membrane protein